MPAVTRNHQVVPKSIANLRGRRPGVLHPRAAMQKEIDKNPAPRPVEFPRAADRSLSDEFAQVIADRTIPVRLRSGETCRAKQNLLLRAQATRHRFPIAGY